MRKWLILSALLPLLLSPVALFAAEPAPSATGIPIDPDATVRLAGTAARVVERDAAAWRELTERLAKAVEAYNPALSADPLPEEEAFQAFRRYCAKLLESGRQVAALYAKWTDARVALADALRKSPAYYHAAAKTLLERASTVRSEAVRDKYRLAADVWERLATRADERAKALGGEDAAAGIADLIAQENQFLEDFLKTLDALPRPMGAERGRADELLAALKDQATRGDQLQKQLCAFRDKLAVAPRSAETTSAAK
jgi:hypothetical protein